MSTLGWLRKRCFDISPLEATTDRRGFRKASPAVERRLEKVGQTFLEGYGAALEADSLEALTLRLNQVDGQWRGFAFEGAAMALALFDLITPRRRDRLKSFLQGAADPHAYMVHVGLGWAVARIPWARANIDKHLKQLDPLLCWLVLDGYGFHQGYFHWRDYVRRQKTITRLSPYARRAFDQGLGRSLWFVEGADVPQITATIANFDDNRQPDLWSGIGLACAYAGGATSEQIATLRDAAGRFLPQVAQGVAFAAKARQRAGNPADHTNLACHVLCDLPADAAAAITDQCLEGLADGETGDQPAYELWRCRVQEQLATTRVVLDPQRPHKEGAAP